MTEEQEKRLCENGYFSYQGYHFKPLRQFRAEENFGEITARLRRDTELGIMAENYYGFQKHPYSHEEFYAASTDKTADIFLCFENQKEYIPCEYELQEYVKEQKRKHDRGRTR